MIIPDRNKPIKHKDLVLSGLQKYLAKILHHLLVFSIAFCHNDLQNNSVLNTFFYCQIFSALYIFFFSKDSNFGIRFITIDFNINITSYHHFLLPCANYLLHWVVMMVIPFCYHRLYWFFL